MSTVGSVITRTQRQLLSGLVEQRNKTNGSLTASATTVTMLYDLTGIREGAVLEIESELLYVWAVDTGSKTVTVERGFNGTVATTHASGTIVIVNPRFPRHQILEAINDDLYDLAAPANGLYRIRTLDMNYNGSDLFVNLPAVGEVIDLIEVRIRYTSTDYPVVRNVQLIRQLPTKDFGSGIALKLNEPERSGDLRVVYKSPFTRVTKESDDLQTVAGFPLSAEDILVMGAQIRLMAPREIKRNLTEAQGDTRRADEVPSGAVTNSVMNLMRLRRERIMAEATKLDSQYPLFLNRR